MRFLLVDSIVEMDPGKRATGVKNVTLSEEFLADHFPHRPIMPGMMIIEALVQLADWVIRCGTDFERLALPAGFDRVKFRRVVRPGDQLKLDAEILSSDDERAMSRCAAHCRGTMVASARISFDLHPLKAYLDPGEARRLFGLLEPEPGAEQPR